MAAAAGPIRPAASVLVLRDGPQGLQVLLMRRPERDQDFRSGACVFPGGVVDAADAAAHAWCLGLDDAAASRRLGEARGGLDFFVAALRECFEEVGLLFVCRADGAAVDLRAHQSALHDWRRRLHRGEATLAQLCQAFDWRLDLREMAYFSHWLTPVVRPKRFDTRFFVRLAPAGQEALPDFGEALELMWLTPDEALDPARDLKLLNVTQRTLHELRGWATARAGFDAALARRGVARILPRPVRGAPAPQFVINGQPAYDEVARLDPEGRGHLAATQEPGDVTQLSPRLWRVAGARRHAYVVTDSARREAAVVDADDDDAAQQRALRALDLAPVRQCLVIPSGDARGALAGAASPASPRARAAGPGDDVAVGADTRLRVVAAAGGGVAVVVAPDGIALGAAPADAAAAQAEWLAPPQGFMRPLTHG